MKTFQQFNEAIESEDIQRINDATEALEGFSENIEDNLEQAFKKLNDIVSELGLSFSIEDALEISNGHIEAEEDEFEFETKLDSEYGEASIVVHANNDDDDVEGELSLKLRIVPKDGGYQIQPDILVYFDGDTSQKLSDIDFEETAEEPEDSEEIEEADDVEEIPADETDEFVIPKDIEDEPLELEPSETEVNDELGFTEHLKQAVLVKMKETGLDLDDVDLVDQLTDKLTTTLETEIDSDAGTPDGEESEEPEQKEPEPENSPVEVYEAVDETPVWNVVLFKPSTHLYITRLLTAKTEKEIEKQIKEKFPEFVVVYILPVTVHNFDWNDEAKISQG